MKLKIVLYSFFLIFAPFAVVGNEVIEKEFGHWVASKDADEFNPNINSCSVYNFGWIPATSREPEMTLNSQIRFYTDRTALTSTGTLEEGKVAIFYEWDNAAKEWFLSSDVYEDGKDVNMQPQVVTAKVDGKIVDFFVENLEEELKGKVELTYRYKASFMPNSPVITNRVSLIGFTQAWNYAEDLCR